MFTDVVCGPLQRSLAVFPMFPANTVTMYLVLYFVYRLSLYYVVESVKNLFKHVFRFV